MESCKINVTGQNADFLRLYPAKSTKDVQMRLDLALNGFKDVYGISKKPRLFSAPGRTELCGNHTDHQHGLVVAAAVDLDNVAAALPNGQNTIRIFSDTHGFATVPLDNLSPHSDDTGTPSSLIRGIAEYLSKHTDGKIGGFDAYISGQVPVGSGLSSSASFEVLIAAVMNGLFFDGRISPEELALAGQYAENIHFGKPCGLMDQTASAVGGITGIDFKDPGSPSIERLSIDFSDFGYALCIIDTGAKHDGLGAEYAAIPAEMTEVANLLGADKLREVQPEKFYSELPNLRRKVSDRALLRAMHFFEEDRRVLSELAALRYGDFKSFLRLVNESGKSSWMLLQNIYPNQSVEEQSAAVALAWCERLLNGNGAFRIHGGGFGGTIQAFVPIEEMQAFKEQMESLTGNGSCRFLSIRDAGAIEIKITNGDRHE